MLGQGRLSTADDKLEEFSYEAAVTALLSPLHQATSKEAIARSAARRRCTVQDMRHYWSRIKFNDSTTSMSQHRIIHITGTKGKGSTACLCQAVLRHHGYTTGLFTSPHLMDIRERIRWNGLPVHPNIFGKAYWKIRRDLESYSKSRAETDVSREHSEDDLPILPGYFRMLTLMAFYIFTTLEVDVWIIEVGMGGRFDATNFIDRSPNVDKSTGRSWRSVCGVTLLDFDHTRILGNTLEKIAWEKGGIFAVDKAMSKPSSLEKSQNLQESAELFADDNTFQKPDEDEPSGSDYSATLYILDSNKPEVLEVFRQCAINEGLNISLVQPVDANGIDVRQALGIATLGLAGAHQYGNATLALHLCYAITRDEDHDSSAQDWRIFVQDSKTLGGLIAARWPARCQTVAQNPSFTFRLDGAHTVQSLSATIDWFTAQKAVRITPRRILVFTCSHERNPVELLELLLSKTTMSSIDGGGPSFFTSVYFAKSDFSRPSPMQVPNAKQLLTDAGYSMNNQASPGMAASMEETWQETLGIIWEHLMSTVVESKVASGTATANNSGLPGLSPTSRKKRSRRTTRAVVKCNMTSSQIIRELASSTIQPTEILVTGSLYLVGSFLKAIHWSEDSSLDCGKFNWAEESKY